jgi:hypothetical protein
MIVFIWNVNGGHTVRMDRSGTPHWFRFRSYVHAPRVAVNPHLCPAQARCITTTQTNGRPTVTLWT